MRINSYRLVACLYIRARVIKLNSKEIQKEEVALAASGARAYNKRWRQKKLSWSEIGKVKYLLEGDLDYMNEETLAYTHNKFNKLRIFLGFKQDAELIDLVVKSGAFRIVRDAETQQVIAFMTPLIPDRFNVPQGQELTEPEINSGVFECKLNAIANSNDHDRISENLRVHKRGVKVKVLLAGNVPQFHKTASEVAVNRARAFFNRIHSDPFLYRHYYGNFLYRLERKYGVNESAASRVLTCFIKNYLADHFSRRVGIENAPEESLEIWLQNYFGPKRMEHALDQAWDTWRNNN